MVNQFLCAVLTLLTCASARNLPSSGPICVSSYDVILKLPLGEKIHQGDGDIPMQFEERFVLHSKCGAALMAKDLPTNIVLIKPFNDPRPVELESIATSLGKVDWVKEKTTEADVEGKEYITQARITLSLDGAKLETKAGVRLTLKWRASRDLPWVVNTEEDKARVGWIDYIDVVNSVSYGEGQSVTLTDVYQETSLSYTLVVPRTRPQLNANLIGNILSSTAPADGDDTSRLSKLEPSGNHGYGGWDVHTYECKLNLAEREQELHNIIWNLTLSLSKTASIPFGARTDMPAVCEQFMEQSHLLVWHYLVGFTIYLFISRMLFGLDAVFASSTFFSIILVRYGWKVIFALLVLAACYYVYIDVRSPTCDALYGISGSRWQLYFAWTVLPSVVFVLLVWPLWLNTMANEQSEEVADHMIAMRKGEQQRERGKSMLFALFCKALAPALYLAVVIFEYRVFVTDAQLIDVKVAAFLSLIVWLPVWLSRGVWRPEPKYMSDRLLLSTFILPILIAFLWHAVY